MIARYTHPDMGRIWSEERRFETWLQVEIAAAEVMADAGIIPHDAARDIRERSKFDVARIAAIEETTQHDVIAFTTAVAEHVGPVCPLAALRPDVLRRRRHRAGAFRCARRRDLLIKNVEGLLDAVRARAEEHRRTPMIGRTHGVHAEPMTFGLKLALWYAELQRDLERLKRARAVVVGRQDLRRGRDVRASRSVDRSGDLPQARAGAGAGLLSGDSARSPRRVADDDRHYRRVAGEVRARSARAAEDRNRRSAGAVRQRPEGLVGDAAQAQSDRFRADYRPRAAAAGQRARGAREHRALARARHLALVGGARDSARQLHRARPHAAPLHAHREGARRQCRPHEARTSSCRAASCSPEPCCSSWRSAAFRANRPTNGCSAMRCARTTSRKTSSSCCSPTPTSCACSTRRPSTMRSISKCSSRTWTHIFDRVFEPTPDCARRPASRSVSPDAREGVRHVEAVGVRSAGKDHRRRAALSGVWRGRGCPSGQILRARTRSRLDATRPGRWRQRLPTSCWRIRLSRVTESRLAEDLTKQPVVATTAEHPKDARHRRGGGAPRIVKKMRFAVIVFPGSNCDHDAYHAAKEVLGQQAEFVWHKETDLRGADAVILPGGFSHGDYLRTGAIARFSPVMDAVRTFAAARRSRARHLQRLSDSARSRPAAWRDAAQSRSEVRCEHVHVRVEQTDTPFTLACRSQQVLRMPIAHGEGNYFTTPEELRRLEQNRQIVFRYVDAAGVVTDESNPNGSLAVDRGHLQRAAERRRADAASGARLRAVGRQRGRSRDVRVRR